MAEISPVWQIVQQWLDQQRFPPSQSKLAQAVGVTRSAVSDWKSGKTRPSPHSLHRLSQLMEPTTGPDTYMRLALAVLEDMGYLPPGLRERAPNLRLLHTGDGSYGRLEGLSEASDTTDDLIAAHDEEGSISAEQGQPTEP